MSSDTFPPKPGEAKNGLLFRPLLNDRRPAGGMGWPGWDVDKERLEAEFAAEVERMRQEARERQEKGLGDDGSGGRGKKKNLPQTIGEGFDDPHTRETDARLARAGGTNRQHLADITQKKQRKRDGRIWWLHRLGWTTREIGEVVGVSHESVRTACQESSKLNFLDMSSRGHTPEEIALAEDVSPRLVEALLLEGLPHVR